MIVSRAMRMRGVVCGVIFVVPFFVFAQTPSITDLERQLTEHEAQYTARMERLQKLEERVASVESTNDTDAERLARAKKNFKVTAPTQAIADKVCETLAVQWMQSKYNGKRLAIPCTVRVKVGQIGAGGATTFSFAGGGRVYGFDMTVQGSLERICDSVVPHEVCHIFNALDLARPLPRWADEGISSLMEIDSERMRQLMLAKEVVGTNRFIPVRELLDITEYPKNMSHVLTLYAEGTALADFLVSRAARASGEQWTQEQARQWMISFMDNAHTKGWDAALFDLSKSDDKPLGNISNVAQLSNEFTAWLKSDKARMYAFKEVISPVGRGLILPVRNTDNGNKRVVPAN